MDISIVATLYCSEGTVREFVKRCRAAAADLTQSYEIVLVNDGSPDNSLDIAVELAAKYKELRVVDLSRNFGHHRAMLAGLEQAQGEKVFLIDSDLEEAPEWLAEFSARQAETNADIVIGVQKARKGGWFERLSGSFFYKVYGRLIRLDLPRNATTARLMNRAVIDALSAYHEKTVFMHGIVAHAGFRQNLIPVTKSSNGETTYNLRRKLSLALDAITSFSSAPLRYVFYSGLAILGMSFLVTGIAIIGWLFYERAPNGWTSLIISIWMLGGLMLSAIGIVGLYLGRIFDEIKERPRVIIRDIHGGY
jgi:putative glycosyltransferase